MVESCVLSPDIPKVAQIALEWDPHQVITVSASLVRLLPGVRLYPAFFFGRSLDRKRVVWMGEVTSPAPCISARGETLSWLQEIGAKQTYSIPQDLPAAPAQTPPAGEVALGHV